MPADNLHVVYFSTMNHNRQTSLQTTHRCWGHFRCDPCASYTHKWKRLSSWLGVKLSPRMCSHSSCPYWHQTVNKPCCYSWFVYHDINQHYLLRLNQHYLLLAHKSALLAQTFPTMMKHLPRFALWYTMSLAFEIYWESRITIYDTFLTRCMGTAIL